MTLVRLVLVTALGPLVLGSCAAPTKPTAPATQSPPTAAERTADFRVIEARWGADTRWMDVTEPARGLATEKGLSTLADYRLWGDPAPYAKKTFVVVYEHAGMIRLAVVYEDEPIKIP